jgi:sn-glycerol 3-phosphate transport system ATP-binding protein
MSSRPASIRSKVDVLDGIDLEIEPGEFVALLGPSGCGKSTLLKMIAGLEDLSDGEIYIDGVLANYLKPAHRNVAMVFQNYALYPHMTVRENVGFPLKMGGMPAGAVRDKVDAAARLLQLTGELDRYPDELSGGQRQRVALGRAIVREPVAFLMDEPLSNLDALLRVEMRTELVRLHRRVGRTTIYVTHDQVEAMTMANRIVLMNKGRIQQVGTPAEIYSSPANTFVAKFVGSPAMNLFEGRLETGAEGRVFRGPFELRLPRGPFPKLSDGPVTLGIRPERVRIAEGKDAGPLVAVVDLVERAGADCNLLTVVGEATPMAVRTSAPTHIVEGERLHVTFPFEDIQFFGADGVRVEA